MRGAISSKHQGPFATSQTLTNVAKRLVSETLSGLEQAQQGTGNELVLSPSVDSVSLNRKLVLEKE